MPPAEAHPTPEQGSVIPAPTVSAHQREMELKDIEFSCTCQVTVDQVPHVEQLRRQQFMNHQHTPVKTWLLVHLAVLVFHNAKSFEALVPNR